MARGSNPGFDAIMWVELVVGSLPCFERNRELQFFPLLKNQHFQIPIRSGAHGHVSTSCHELLSAPWVPNYNLQLQLQFSGSKAEYFFEPLPTSYIVFPCEFGYDATASRSFSGNWLAPALLHSSRLPLFLFQAQLVSRG